RILVSYDWARWGLSASGAALVVLATLLRFAAAGRAKGERAPVERSLAGFAAVGLAAIALYFATNTEMARDVLGIADAAPETRGRIEGATTIGWIVLV